MLQDRCPACNRPFALVGRVHRCVPEASRVHLEGSPAGTQAIGAYQSAMGETPPSTGEAKHLHRSANRGEPCNNSNVVPIRKPKRDRAAYMRDYRARKKNAGSAA